MGTFRSEPGRRGLVRSGLGARTGAAGAPTDESVSRDRTEAGARGRRALAKPRQPQHPPAPCPRFRTTSELQRPKERSRRRECTTRPALRQPGLSAA